MNLYRELGDRGSEVMALNLYASVFTSAGEPARARVHHREALRLAREIGARWDVACAL